jgi:hypothetical protein
VVEISFYHCAHTLIKGEVAHGQNDFEFVVWMAHTLIKGEVTHGQDDFEFVVWMSLYVP